MNDIVTDTKNRAKRLRTCLAEHGITFTHSQSLETIAKMEGCRDWNTLSAQLQKQQEAKTSKLPYQVGDRIGGSYRGSPYEGTILGLEKTGGADVWRIKIEFDKTVKLSFNPALNLTRKRIRSMINKEGHSVNLKGSPDGWLTVNHMSL